ncbi:hypothetical protein VFPFJ_05912 [Purpureocillium lilacinum]|uniref:Uncharacterized protein n=1 Tax=Purpureocillium lilacinum TaxID=33203 RepID=A0A179HJ52_PURLI|nr:hypothetical protein VFPFJ_05912 [Purpureocillium lilacinum]OAQ84950.1 hypothetical protein VFPBJ_03719 [Purpureocillium lilacinum]OAQ89500.1 hypothetical protein VFPFJ_05912 [Purpureocillium lilacinum]
MLCLDVGSGTSVEGHECWGKVSSFPTQTGSIGSRSPQEIFPASRVALLGLQIKRSTVPTINWLSAC